MKCGSLLSLVVFAGSYSIDLVKNETGMLPYSAHHRIHNGRIVIQLISYHLP
jgi:hypothetical protein